MTQPNSNTIAIYHVIRAHDSYEKAAEDLFNLVREAQARHPGMRRALYLDINGHCNPAGGFDRDMFELQKEFMLGVLYKFVSVIDAPLYHIVNPEPQDDNIPDHIAFAKIYLN